MIHIEMNTISFLLKIEGHAEPEEHKDYVQICAAASMLAQALVFSITKFNGDHDALSSIKYKDEPGDLMLRVFPEEWARISIAKRFNYYGDGLEMLALAHPECVEFIWNGEKVKPDKEVIR